MQLFSTASGARALRLARAQTAILEIRPGEVVRCRAGRVHLADASGRIAHGLPAGATLFCRTATRLSCESLAHESILEVRVASPEDRIGTRRLHIHSREALLQQAREERREVLKAIASATVERLGRLLGRLRRTATSRRVA